jgi:hypothetical protein
MLCWRELDTLDLCLKNVKGERRERECLRTVTVIVTVMGEETSGNTHYPDLREQGSKGSAASTRRCDQLKLMIRGRSWLAMVHERALRLADRRGGSLGSRTIGCWCTGGRCWPSRAIERSQLKKGRDWSEMLLIGVQVAAGAVVSGSNLCERVTCMHWFNTIRQSAFNIRGRHQLAAH